MKTEYRIIFTATFDTAAERDRAYDSLKTAPASQVAHFVETRLDLKYVIE